MSKQFWWTSAVLAILSIPSGVIACPYCRVATQSLVDSTLASEGKGGASTSQPGAQHWWSFAAGIDVLSAYYHRGQLQEDKGGIIQPFGTVAYSFGDIADWKVTPFINVNSSYHFESNREAGTGFGHSHGGAGSEATILNDTNDFYEVKAMAGIVAEKGKLSLEVDYIYYTSPNDSFQTIQEAGFRVGYDFFKTKNADNRFSLKPYADIFVELDDMNGDENAFAEIGVVPSIIVGDTRKLGISFPVAFGVSLDDYYSDEQGDEHTLGYVSAAARFSVPLTQSSQKGTWYLNWRVEYLYLDAPNLRLANGGEHDEVIFAAGISFVR